MGGLGEMYEMIRRGRSHFASEAEVKVCIERHRHFNPDEEDCLKTKILLLYHSKYEKSYLVFTNKRIYWVMDVLQKNRPIINFAIETDNNIITIETSRVKVNRKISDQKGFLRINEQKNLIYYREYFENQDKDIISVIRQLIMSSKLN